LTCSDSGDFGAKIAPLNALSNGKSLSSRAKGRLKPVADGSRDQATPAMIGKSQKPGFVGRPSCGCEADRAY
jgi:hypothetical protein